LIPIALRHLRLPVLLGLVMQCAGCSTLRPVLYPNEHYTTVGDAVAQADIDACMTRAKEYVKAGGADAQKGEGGRQTDGLRLLSSSATAKGNARLRTALPAGSSTRRCGDCFGCCLTAIRRS
jgi:hypothetical protein